MIPTERKEQTEISGGIQRRRLGKPGNNYACVTQEVSGEKASMCVFSLPTCSEEMNWGK